MARRYIPFIDDQIYHVTNRSISELPIFYKKRDCQRFLHTMSYYRSTNINLSFSRFNTLPLDDRKQIWNNLQQVKKYSIDILCYCLMTNHFHILIKQKIQNGISKYISDIANSFARYFNIKNKRRGTIFEGNFKAIRIETDNQLLHVARYIHLNPYSSYKIKSLKDLVSYPYSSLVEYLNASQNNITNKDILLSYFKSIEDFKKFTLNQADYQRQIQNIKYLILE